MHTLIYIFRSDDGKIAIAKSSSYESMVLPYSNFNECINDDNIIENCISKTFSVKADKITKLSSGVYGGNRDNKYDCYIVTIDNLSNIRSNNFERIIVIDPYKAMKLVFAEPFTLLIADYLKSISN